MTAGETNLDALQRWMLGAITESAAADDEATIVLPSSQQSAAERLAVYRNAYLARLLDVLREQFPCLRFAIGDELFDQFLAGYLQQHPPHSYTLARLADNLVDHLDATRPSDWGQFVVELARLEQAIDRIFDGPGPENLPRFKLSTTPGADVRLAFVPGFELHDFQYPVSTYYTDWKAGNASTWPGPQPQFLALLRRDYIVRRYELSSLQFELLDALQRGARLDAALSGVVGETSGVSSIHAVAANVGDWFQFWASEQFFAAAT
ncbi:MAG TPA: DNA-binding domain-containing protein [Pirellulales bacterium]